MTYEADCLTPECETTIEVDAYDPAGAADQEITCPECEETFLIAGVATGGKTLILEEIEEEESLIESEGEEPGLGDEDDDVTED
jgi:hypothetical protein